MELRERVAKFLAPDLLNGSQVKDLVKGEVLEAVTAARQAMPTNVNYDPKGEGYRPLAGTDQRRDLAVTTQDKMLEIAYYLYDTSGLVKRLCRDTKNFVLGEGISLAVENDNAAGDALEVFTRFWNDPYNQMDLRLESRVEFLGVLGEQCYPVSVDRTSGRVWLTYLDPGAINTVDLVPNFPEMPAAVRVKGSGGRSGKIMSAIRPETDPRLREYNRLVGECFYFGINKPPNGSRGRSDLVHLFDFIDNFEEGLFDELDRIRLMKSFIWDVELKGATSDEIRKFLEENKTPKPASIRAHNDQVKWSAETPTLNNYNTKALFDLMKSYLAACMNRPDSWLGGGGKAYQNEADLMGEPTFKDLASRQRYVKFMLESIGQFVLDQAILAGTLKDRPESPLKARVNMPSLDSKDQSRVITALMSLTQSLVLAMTAKLIRQETAIKLFLQVAGQLGLDLDEAAEIAVLLKAGGEDGLGPDGVPIDYQAQQGLLGKVLDVIKATQDAVPKKSQETAGAAF